MRELFVKVDGLREQSLRFDQRLQLDLPIGHHTLKITNRLFSKSEGFDLDADQTVEFLVENLWIKGVLAGLFVISGTGAYRVDLKRV
jgi:hypothetical protein